MLRTRAVLVTALATMIPIATVALAAGPLKGARYSGQVKNAGVPISVTFKVSRSGKRITAFALNVPNLPNRCGYGGPDQVHHASAPIKQGRFTAKLTEKTAGGVVVATATASGRFRSGHRETGTIKTTARTSSCSGSFNYTTRAK
jgi:hypothetical protein